MSVRMIASGPFTVLGTAVVDRVVHLPSRLNAGGKQAATEERVEIGGNGYNCWQTARALGGNCRLVAMVGQDAEGAAIAAACSGGGKRSNIILVCERGRTVTSTVIVGGGERTCVSSPHRSRVRGVQLDDVEKIPLEAGELVVSDGRYGEATRALKERGAIILCDFEWRESMSHDGGKSLSGMRALLGIVDFAKVDEELVDRVYAREVSQLLKDARGARWVVVTNGGAGSVLYARRDDSDEQWSTTKVGARRVDVVDSTGAGDGFVGGLAVSLAKTEDPVEIVKYASVVGAEVCRKKGGHLVEKMTAESVHVDTEAGEDIVLK